jgi:hypothetical protein
MRSTAIRASLSIAVFLAVIAGELLVTDFRTRATLEPGRPLRTDLEDTVVFRGVRSSDGEPVITAIERSTESDFDGMMADLEEAGVASPEYGVSQRNSQIRISTNNRRSPQGACPTFFKLFLPESGSADSVTIQGRPADGGDRAGKSGILEFDLRALNSTAALSLTLDPGENPPQTCAGEFWVGTVHYQMEALKSVRFDLNPGKRATFRFSRQPGPDGEVRLESGFLVSSVSALHTNGNLKWQYSTASSKGISIEELALHPGSWELSLSGEALWLDPEGRHWREWGRQNPGRALLYFAIDLCLLAGAVRLSLRTYPPPPPPPQPQSGRPYVFISYAREDSDYTRRLYAALRRGGVDVFFDIVLGPGDEWVKRLHDSIEGCFAMVVLMTPESAESRFVTREIRLAQETRRPILPVLVRRSQNLLLMDLQQIEARDNDPAPALLAALERMGYPFSARASAATSSNLP